VCSSDLQSLSPLATVVQASLNPTLIIFGSSFSSLEAYDYSISPGADHVPFTLVRKNTSQELLSLIQGLGSPFINVTSEINPFQIVYQGAGFSSYRFISITLYSLLIIWTCHSVAMQVKAKKGDLMKSFILLFVFSTTSFLLRIVYLATSFPSCWASMPTAPTPPSG